MKTAQKLLAITLTVCLLATAAVTASAEKASLQDIGGLNTRVIADFENLDGAVVGGHDALFGTDASSGTDFGVKNGFGAGDSHAFVMGNVSADNLFAEASYNPNGDAAAKTEGLEKATDLVFYVNGAGETGEIAFQLVIGEWDYDADGKPVMKTNPDTGAEENAITFWKAADDINTKYYALADGATEWTEYTGTSYTYIRLPGGFKGYVRIPLDTFDPTWGSQDVNGRMDLKHFTRFSFYYGIYNRHASTGYAIAIDNLGFAGADLEPDVVPEDPDKNGNNNLNGGNPGDDTGTDPGKNEVPEQTNPETGDAVAASWAVLALACGAVSVWTGKKKR